MKKISLTRGYETLVSDEDYDLLCQFRWHVSERSTGCYARRFVPDGDRRYCFSMHNAILPLREGFVVDHKDRDGLNNQRDNLRYATYSQNAGNSQSQRKYKGVSFHSHSGLWHVRITHNRVAHSVGYFKSEIDAAVAYNSAALSVFGEFALLNEV